MAAGRVGLPILREHSKCRAVDLCSVAGAKGTKGLGLMKAYSQRTCGLQELNANAVGSDGDFMRVFEVWTNGRGAGARLTCVTVSELLRCHARITFIYNLLPCHVEWRMMNEFGNITKPYYSICSGRLGSGL